MAAPQVKSPVGGIFGPSSDELKKKQQADYVAAGDSSGYATDRQKALGPGFGSLGALVGGSLPGAYQDPEIKKASSIESGIQQIDDSFEPDPNKTDLENEAAKLGMYEKSVGHLLSPDQKLALSAQRFAYLNDAFQQARLKSEDARADAKSSKDLDVAKIDLQIKQQQLEDAKNSAEFGDQKDEAVYALPDGSETAAPVGSEKWRLLQKRGLPYKGTRSELNQMGLQREKDRLAGKKSAYSSYTAKERESFLSLSGTTSTLAQILNMDDPSNPDGRFFANAAGWKGYLDAAKETFNAFVGTDVFSSASQAGTQLLNKYRVDLQQLIKGIPSDKDQTIVDATRPVRGDAASKNRDRVALAIQDIAQRARIAYAEARMRVGEGNEEAIPAGIVATLRQLGVDPKTVSTADDEYQTWNDDIYSAALQMAEQGAASVRKTGGRSATQPISLDNTGTVTLDN
jgi:hypothetical protein